MELREKSTDRTLEETKEEKQQKEKITVGADEMLFFSALKNRKLRTREGAKAGKIKDLLISKQTGKIDYVLLRVKRENDPTYIGVPFHAIEYRGPEKSLLLKMTREALYKAPSFEKARFRDLFIQKYDMVDSYWGGYFGNPQNPLGT